MNAVGMDRLQPALENRTLLSYQFTCGVDSDWNQEQYVGASGELIGLSGAMKGTISDIQADGRFKYKPNPGAIGEDTFTATFQGQSSGGTYTYQDQVTATIYLPVTPYNDDSFVYEPASMEVNYFVLKGNTLTISADDGLLVNDTATQYRQYLSTERLTSSMPESQYIPDFSQKEQWGTFSIGGNGDFTYTPEGSAYDNFPETGRVDFCYYRITDSSGAKRGVAKVEVDLAEIFIARNGVNVDLNPALLDVWVGEKVAVSVGTKGHATLVPAETSFQWCVPGQAIDGYTGYGDGHFGENDGDPDSASVGHSIPLSSDELDNSSLDFYWIEDGTEDLSVSMSTIGQTSFKSNSFDIRRPNVSVTVVTRNLRIVDNDRVSFSDVTAGGEILQGITFTRSLDDLADTLGSYRWTQIITKSNYTWNDANGGFHTGHATLGADNYATYQHGNHVTAFDSPGAPLPAEWTTCTRDFGASMYLMWRHQSADSIWTSLSVTDWGYYSRAIRQNGVWTLSQASLIVPPATQSTSTLPEWDDFFLNNDDITEDN